MNLKLDPTFVTVRDLAEADLPAVLDYWFRSPAGYIESLGVDLAKLPDEPRFAESLLQRVRQNAGRVDSKLNSLAILYDQTFVGFHNLNPITEGDFGVFHAHIWRPEFRRRGIAERSYLLACRVFLERFHLQRILFKTPAQNLGAIRVKEKLGIRCIGEELVSLGVIRDGTLAKVFELSREEAGVAELPRASAGVARSTGAGLGSSRRIEVDDLTRPQVLALLQEHLANMREISPPKSVHALDVNSLRAPDITFWTVWEGDQLLGCGALKELSPTHGEVKSMRTPAALRRRGAGRTILTHLIQVARERGYRRLNLETGAPAAFDPARKLYESFGFTYCGPFGSYREDPFSVFMELRLEG